MSGLLAGDLHPPARLSLTSFWSVDLVIEGRSFSSDSIASRATPTLCAETPPEKTNSNTRLRVVASRSGLFQTFL